MTGGGGTARGAAPRPAAWRALAVPAAMSAIMLATLLGLGVWQLERKGWKEGLLAAVAARAYGEPVPIPAEAAWPAWRAETDEFRRVRLTGTFEAAAESPVHGLAEERRGQPLQGLYLFVPLRLADGSVVMVNRGIVPTALRAPEARPGGLPAGPVTVTGLLRAPEGSRPFVPANDPARNEWFTRDVPAMGAAKGLTRLAPFYVDADGTPNPGGWPRGGQTQLTLPNNHLGYALTWFGLAAGLVAVFGVWAARRISGDELQSQDPGHDQPDAGEAQRIG